MARKLKQSIVIDVAREGQSLVAKTVGEIHGNSSNKQFPLHMKEELDIPELHGNLISVKKLVMAGVQVNFVDMVAVLKKYGEVIDQLRDGGEL